MLIIGERYTHLLKNSPYLSSETVVWMPDNPLLDPRLAGHADLNILKTGTKDLMVSSCLASTFVTHLTNVEISVHLVNVAGKQYPEDAGLCICQTGKYILYNPKTASETALKHLNGVSIAVTQGYTKCSVCVVSEDAIITSDRIIAIRAENAGLNVLHIHPGFIKLDGFDYGFIGGSTFMLNKETLAFTGHFDHHPDSDRIMQFLKAQGVRPVFLTKRKIFDIGGAILL